MKKFKSIFASLIILLTGFLVNAQSVGTKTVYIVWKGEKRSGSIKVINGEPGQISIASGKGRTGKNTFTISSNTASSLSVTIKNVNIKPGPNPTIVHVQSTDRSFSFLLRDVTKEHPIYIPLYGVLITNDSNASYVSIENFIRSKNLKSKLDRINERPEASFDGVKTYTRNQKPPVWLGLSRDMRIFQVSESIGNNSTEVSTITPLNAAEGVPMPGQTNRNIIYSYALGRGQAVEQNITRHLEQGIMPILHVRLVDEYVRYESIQFVSPEKNTLKQSSLKGTHYLVADKFSAGHMHTTEQEARANELIKRIDSNDGSTVLYFRTLAINTAATPQYAWFKTIRPGSGWWDKIDYQFDKNTGRSSFGKDNIFCIARLNGIPVANEEMAVLLQPDDTAVIEFVVPHEPVSNARAVALSKQSFEQKYLECKEFWNQKLQKAARIRLPEKRIEQMLQAGLLHLDLISYGIEPDSTIAPSIGVYSPIGTESAPIIQFYNSMGWHDMARRSLQFFLEKQHDDGLIQNFGGYMVETGAALWSIGEYMRYTNDTQWFERNKEKILKSCNYLLNWRNRNKLDSLKGKGYGMISGKVADPEDHFHQFMLNGYAYLGISRMAEAFRKIDRAEAARLERKATAWKQDILTSFYNSMAQSPVVPLSNGTWVPTAPPWTEANGPRALYTSAERFFSHGTFTVSDAMLGPLYLVFTEVLAPQEEASGIMLDYHRELFYQNNAAFSQPYYSRHNWLQLKLGLTKAFLQTYYATMSALADRETYTFWEHLYHVSVHKTHEEGWFLMETRWMLYMEEQDTLKLLSAIPRDWMKNGKEINIENAASYFGNINVKTVSSVDWGYIDVEIDTDITRKPSTVVIRIPHPDGKRGVNVSEGVYDSDNETVTIGRFTGKIKLRLEF